MAKVIPLYSHCLQNLNQVTHFWQGNLETLDPNIVKGDIQLIWNIIQNNESAIKKRMSLAWVFIFIKKLFIYIFIILLYT